MPYYMVYLWGHARRYNAYTNYIKALFSGRVQKLSVNAGMSCPNRDGLLDTRGCLFCENKAFNPGYCRSEKSISQQLREGMKFHRQRYRKANIYLAYFQAFSNTHAPVDRLAALYYQALETNGIAGLVIGTRPDCIDKEKLDLLESLAKKWYIKIEYGIASCYDKTLTLINRRHSFAQTVEAIRKTADRGIETGGHMIFGLPQESYEEMLAQADILSHLPLSSVKFHQLQIIKGTAMETLYKEHPEYFYNFTLDDYVQFIIHFTEKLNPAIMIERFAGEVPPRFLAKANFSLLRYDEILRKIEAEMEKQNSWQGRLFKKDNTSNTPIT